MSIKLNNIQITNWTEYIYTKFSDKSLYEIKNKEDSGLVVKSKTNKTVIYFVGLSDDSLTLQDCQYYNDDCKGWSGEIIQANHGGQIFNQTNVDLLDNVLRTPIEIGWRSVDYYLGDRFCKSKTYYDKDKSKTPFVFVPSNFGCLRIALLPFFFLFDKLIDVGLVGHKKEVVIDGIKKSAH